MNNQLQAIVYYQDILDLAEDNQYDLLIQTYNSLGYA